MAWSFQPIPRRLLQHEVVLELTAHDRAVLFSLYVGSDEHGRFRANPQVLAILLGMVGQHWEPLEAVNRLADWGMLHLYTGSDGRLYGVLDQFDQDIASEQRRKRPRSIHPSPPRDVWRSAGVDGEFRKGRHRPGDCLANARTGGVHTPSRHGPPKEVSKQGMKEGPQDLARGSGLHPVCALEAIADPADEYERRQELRGQCEQ